jgi:hypothetical protein
MLLCGVPQPELLVVIETFHVTLLHLVSCANSNLCNVILAVLGNGFFLGHGASLLLVGSKFGVICCLCELCHIHPLQHTMLGKLLAGIRAEIGLVILCSTYFLSLLVCAMPGNLTTL